MKETTFPTIVQAERDMMRARSREQRQPSLLTSFAIGTLAGIAASAAMNLFQSYATSLFESRPRDSANREQGAQKQKKQPEAQLRGSRQQAKPATVVAAERLAPMVLGRKLRRSEEEPAGQFMHYLMGASSAAIYGVVAEHSYLSRAAQGVAFGTAVWLLADEITVPALGLSKPPQEYPIHVHATSLAAHVVFGFVTEQIRRLLKDTLYPSSAYGTTGRLTDI